MALNTILIQQKFYDQVRDFYQAVRAGDEDQIVLTPARHRPLTNIEALQYAARETVFAGSLAACACMHVRGMGRGNRA